MPKIKTLVPFFILIALLCNARVTAQTCDDVKIPSSLAEYVDHTYSTWRLVNTNDLEEYHRQTWRIEHPKLCPGLARGNFGPYGKFHFALLLIPKAQSDQRAIVVLLIQYKSGFRSRKLDEIKIAKPVPVLFAGPAGKYRSYDSSKKIVSPYDVVSLVFYESSATVFYWAKTGYKSLQVTD